MVANNNNDYDVMTMMMLMMMMMMTTMMMMMMMMVLVLTAKLRRCSETRTVVQKAVTNLIEQGISRQKSRQLFPPLAELYNAHPPRRRHSVQKVSGHLASPCHCSADPTVGGAPL